MSLNLYQRVLLALASGVVNVLIFPTVELTLLSWVVLVPLLLATYGEGRSGRAFLYGGFCGVVFFFGACYWITDVLRNYGGLSWLGSLLSFLILVVYLSLYYATFSLGFAKFSQHFPEGCFLLAPALWVSTEYLRGHLLTGFPWCLLGYALVDYSNLAKIATGTGVYGLSFTLVLVNALVALTVVKQTKSSLAWLATAIVCILLLTGFFFFNHAGTTQPLCRANIVQPNLSPEQKWDLETKMGILDNLVRLSLTSSPRDMNLPSNVLRFTVWPETPAPFYFNHDAAFHQRMIMLARNSSSYLLFGFVDFKSNSNLAERESPYNSVALLSPQGDLISQYDKVHLVPFGEYVPYPGIFFFIEKISTEAGNFKPGARLVVSSLDENHQVGCFICYEAIFPELVRQFVNAGAGVLFNLTNDRWFGDTVAPYQHLNMARLRAIENQRYLVRAANSGISAVIDPNGVVLKSSPLNVQTLLETEFAFESNKTLYTRFGDWFSWLCLLTVLLASGRLLWKSPTQASMKETHDVN